MKVKRSKFNDLKRILVEPEILILLGARQVGKSTLMEDLMAAAKKQGRPFRSFNLEFPEDLLFFSRSEVELFGELTRKPNLIIFVDEFHYLKNASKVFKGIYDLKKNIKIVACGSSSLEIHKHLKESLAGRRRIFKIHPLVSEEWKQTKGAWDKFLIYGGMPGLLHKKSREEKIEYLFQIVQTYIMKDVKGLIREENIRAFNHLLFFLAENQGQVMPTSNIAREIRVTSKTVEHYLDVLEQTYVLHKIVSYSGNLSNELKKSKKYYFYDNGVRNSLLKNFAPLERRKDVGFLYESHVFLELHARLKANVDIRFWRTKRGDEVDFVWVEDRIPIPIEVKSQASPDRPPNALIKFLNAYSDSPWGMIFNPRHSKDLKFEGKTIKMRTFRELGGKKFPM